MMISRWNVFKEWTEPHEVLHEQWRTESSTGYLIMLNNFHHGLYIPAVCHASFVSQVPKIHFDTLMHLCSYPLQQASSLLSPLSPWDTFWEMRHLLIWCTKIDVQVTSMGTEERGEGGGPNREMRRAQRRGKQEIQRNGKVWRHGQDCDILLAAFGLKKIYYFNKLSTTCCLQAKPCNITWIWSFLIFFSYSRLSIYMTSLALSTWRTLHCSSCIFEDQIYLEICPLLKCPAFETVLNKERSLSSWMSLIRTEHQESEFFSLRSSGILSHAALSSFLFSYTDCHIKCFLKLIFFNIFKHPPVESGAPREFKKL